jgi:hypothetical protein
VSKEALLTLHSIVARCYADKGVDVNFFPVIGQLPPLRFSLLGNLLHLEDERVAYLSARFSRLSLEASFIFIKNTLYASEEEVVRLHTQEAVCIYMQ